MHCDLQCSNVWWVRPHSVFTWWPLSFHSLLHSESVKFCNLTWYSCCIAIYLEIHLFQKSKVLQCQRNYFLQSIPHICHRHHRRCLCKKFLSGVIFSRLNAKISHCVCNATQCIILYTVCNLHNMYDYTHSNVTLRSEVYNLIRYIQCV